MLNKNTWVFRVSSRVENGGGHVMRCLSIGRELNKYCPVHFLLCKGGEFWIDRILDYGITASIYKSPKEVNNKNLLVDGYDFSNVEINSWNEKCNKIVFIDDNCSSFKNVDLIISTCMIKFDNSKVKKEMYLLGPKYALIAPEYSKKNIGKNKKNVTDVLVFCGMRDSNNYIGKVLTTLCKANYKENVTIAIGSSSPNLEKILSSIKDYNFSVNVEIDSKSLYDLLIDSDMVIGSGGVNLLERMSLGRPSVTIVTAENQMGQAKWSEEIGATILINPVDKEFDYKLLKAILLLLKSRKKRLEISEKSSLAIDGNGAARVADVLFFLGGRYNV